MITAEGLERRPGLCAVGSGEDALRDGRRLSVSLDLRPDLSGAVLADRLGRVRKGESLSNRLRKQAGLSPAAVALLREAAPGVATMDAPALSAAIKALPLAYPACGRSTRAISSAGGVRWRELDDGLMLRDRPGVFCAGEMIDWEAPTGGYLLQACFATGAVAAAGADAWLRARGPDAGGRPPPAPA